MFSLSVLLLVMFGGCAGKQTQPQADPAEALERWTQFLASSSQREADSGPFSIIASLRYQNGDSGHRVTMRIWGNESYPLRLDVEAGIGAMVAQVREDHQKFVAFSPREDKALVHNGKGKPALALGLPIPFTIKDMVLLVQGHYTQFFPEKFTSATVVGNGVIAYSLPSSHKGTEDDLLLLDPLGRPVQWTTQGRQGWRIDFLRYSNAPQALPDKIDVIMTDKKTATLFIKSRNRHNSQYTEAELALELPAGIKIQPIRMH
ncbi:hypothetical protein [Oleidesulfovibrio sp.]|uniref:hypothetical protein n=1 Tax=Oleidesulfovibrio sp. TaxID=2909707 RepID=UPI003A8B9E71